jgi:hypothetical protein
VGAAWDWPKGGALNEGFPMDARTACAALFLLGVVVAPMPGGAGFAAGGEKAADASDAVKLTPAEIAEKEARKACKVEICKSLRASSEASGDIACHVVKSWRKEQLVKLVSKLKVSWPYDGAQCSTDLSVNRGDLVKAMKDAKTEVAFQKHTVTCTIASEKKGATQFKFDLTPKVTFENGKATKAHANWGKIEAPTLIKSAMWTATAADNTVNLLSGTIVEEVNDFVFKRCDEVKDEWAGQPK